MKLVEVIEDECPIGWLVSEQSANRMKLRTSQLSNPHGFTVVIEWLAFTGSAEIILDAFVNPVVKSSLEAATLKLLNEGWPLRSASNWESRLAEIRGPENQVAIKFDFRDPEGSTSDGTSLVAYDALQALGTFLRLALVPEANPAVEKFDETTETGLPEGSVTQVVVNRYERDPRNRAVAIKVHGASCTACGFDFGHEYGDVAAGYIHVHHLTPVSEIGPNYVINPVLDLVPLCPNCHAAVHRRNPPYSIDELRALRLEQQQPKSP
jgi:HNH endonuclease